MAADFFGQARGSEKSDPTLGCGVFAARTCAKQHAYILCSCRSFERGVSGNSCPRVVSCDATAFRETFMRHRVAVMYPNTLRRGAFVAFAFLPLADIRSQLPAGPAKSA